MSAGPHDRDLILFLRQRRPGAFDELYRRYKDRLWRFLVSLTGHPDRAEDLFQETWLAAARNAHRLRADSLLAAWLFTIARNKHRNSLRSALSDQSKRAALVSDPLPNATGGAPDERADAHRLAARLATAMAGLPLVHREALLLSVQEGLDVAQMAAVLGLREDAVRKRLSRARAELARACGLQPTIEGTSSHE